MRLKLQNKYNDLYLESKVYNPLSGIYLNQNKVNLAFELIEN
jgi:hypothetical protein